MGIALHAFHDTYMVLPPGLGAVGDRASDFNPTDPAGLMFASWHTHILPYVEQSALYTRMTPNTYGLGLPVPLYACPSDLKGQYGYNFGGTTQLTTSYAGVAGVDMYNTYPPSQMDGMLHWRSRVNLLMVRDGTSNTIMVGERPATTPTGWWGWWDTSRDNYTWWDYDCLGGVDNTGSWIGYQNDDYTGPACPTGAAAGVYRSPGSRVTACNFDHFYSYHPGGAMFGMGDGSVRFIPYSAASILRHLATRQGGEVINSSLLP